MLFDIDCHAKLQRASAQRIEQVYGLGDSVAVEAEEVVGPALHARVSGLEIVQGEIGIAEIAAFGGLDEYELHAGSRRGVEVHHAVMGRDVDSSHGV